ncbi:MAG TPA: extracellular solute-binding protein [Dongiaceae bacterium]
MLRNAFRMTAAAALLFASSAAYADGELHLYNWGDYTNPKLIEKFEQQYNVTVTLDDYDSNDTLLAKIRAGNTGYDVVFPSDYAVKILLDEGFLAKTEPNKMENFKNVDPRWVDVYWDSGRNYSVPWQWGTTNFAVDTAIYSGDIDTLAILFDPPAELDGKINMQPEIVEVIHAGFRYLGKPLCNGNPEDLKAVNDLLVKAKPHWRTIDYGMIEPLVAGDVAVSHGWNGAAMRARLQKPTIKYAYPKEGVAGWMDNAVVLADAPNMENAKLWQNFIMDPENAALISDFAKYANGIMGSEKFLPKEFAEAPEIMMPANAPTPTFQPPCPQEVTEKYNQIWTNLLK